MQGYNCIMVYDQEKKHLLFCKRKKEPYKGLYNFVGGKIEEGEDGFIAAYRELEEETGINEVQIQLSHMMDFTYYNQGCYVEMYVGQLTEEVKLKEELHPLYWLEVNENFFDMDRFAGEGNIGHMVEQAKQFGVGQTKPTTRTKGNKMDEASLCLGIDGCKGGWIVAVINKGELVLERIEDLKDIMSKYYTFDECLLDMVIGLQGNLEQIRPDTFARKIIRERTSTIFPAPCRQAVYALDVATAYEENKRVLGKKFTPFTVGILPKMREVDLFLQQNNQYKNKIKESHPEVCFARLNGSTLLTKKSNKDGIEERIRVLSAYIPALDKNEILLSAKKFHCNTDDIIDAICLAVTANLVAQGEFETIPKQPMRDDTGILMQMIIPKNL